MRQRVVRVVALLLVIFLCSGYTALTFWPEPPQTRPNVLIISLCSFRYKMLQEYNHTTESIMPAMDRFFAASSFVFENIFNGMPWTALFSTAQSVLPGWEIERMLYTRYVNSSRDYIIRVPHRESWLHPPSARIDDNDFEKNHSQETEFIRRSLLKPESRPFFMLAHYKYMHYPLIDRFNADSEWDYYLSKEEKALVAEYSAHPGKYPDKLPFLLLLTNSDEVPLANPRITADMDRRQIPKNTRSEKAYKFKGLLTDPAFLAAWKNSPGYEKDLVLLEKLYKANARYLDKVLAPALNLWGDKELQRTTVVMVTGDHGEMHMEHDMLTHAHSLYDEVLRIPLAIRFPGHRAPVRIEEQTHFRPVAQLLRGVLSGTVDAENFEKSFRKVQDDAVVLRNCTNTKRGVRYKNQYKYIFDVAEDRPYLYDLKKDPGENENIADANMEMVDKFETMFWKLYPDFKTVDHGDCLGAGDSGGE
ncbi:MAG: sulfatase-like hydrolase/transferase [Bdellovibrionales bacterium]|nr:sulfatase-like hydrolase/transferase [Bdellovibrionales bacterium]